MPKASLPIVKRSEKTEDEKLRRVSDWAKKELTSIQKNSKLPICIQLQNGDYLVGTNKVTKVSNICWQADGYDFNDKRSAIFYCAMKHSSKLAEAKELKEIDWLVGKLDSDKSLFRVRLDNAHLNDDSFKIDLYSSRYEDSKRRLAKAKQELEKIISRAKYVYGTL